MNALIRTHQNKPVTTSRLVAEKFGKEHSNVIKAIKNLDITEDFRRVNFNESEFSNSQGKTFTEYIMTRDGFTLLVMGFTGKEAMKFKVEFINAFTEYENHFMNSQSQKQLSPAEILLLQAENMVRIEKEQTEIKETVNMLVAKTTTRSEWYTVAGYAHLKGVKKLVDREYAKYLGKKASTLLRSKGGLPGRTHDERYGEVNTYPPDVLEEVFQVHVYPLSNKKAS